MIRYPLILTLVLSIGVGELEGKNVSKLSLLLESFKDEILSAAADST
jgi:hypothetical protein